MKERMMQITFQGTYTYTVMILTDDIFNNTVHSF